ncbi:MAG: glycosyltransferase family 39 protein [Candidatus Roizmanbacteria bacterium]
MNLKNNFVLMLLIILSSFLIFYQFTFIPKYLTFDEVEFTKLALSLDGKQYTPYSLLATGHSTLYFYILLLSFKTFGVNVFALRFPAAIFGILSVILFYFIIKKLKNYKLKIKKYNVLPFLLTFIFLTSRWFLNFSRFAFEPTFLLFLELASIYFLFQCFKTLKWQNLILSGIFSGLTFNSYIPGRIFFLLPLGFLIFKLVNPLTRKQFNNLTIKPLLLFLIPFLIIITPLTTHLLINKDARIDQQFFLRNSKMAANEKISGLWHNISSNTLMFFTQGDMNGRHNYPNKPALNPILGILFITGFIIAIKQWNNFTNQLFIIYFFLSFFPTLMTYPWENPNMLRTFTVIPSLVYFIGLAIVSISKKIKAKYLYLIFFVVFLSSLYEIRTYFKYQAKVFEDSFEIQYSLDKAIKLKNPYEKINKK